MSPTVERLRRRISDLQAELETELARRGKDMRYRIVNGRIVFEDAARQSHKALRQRIRDFLANSSKMSVLTAPVIYSLIVPFALIDLWVTIYQAICFPGYKIPKVRRREYIRIDRHKLAYLNGIQKLNCLYCGYANGVIAYVREVAARTEAYWCPIKHATPVPDPHDHYGHFTEFGDGEGFAEGFEASRKRIRRIE